MFFNAYETEEALWDTSRQRDPLVDLAEGFVLGRIVGGWLKKKLAGRK